jgi:hypothetical protein
VESVDTPVFLAAAATDRTMQGYVEISANRLQRAKAANPSLEVAGVTFKKVLR